MKKMLGLIVGFIIAVAPLAAFGAPFQDFKDNTNTSKMSLSEGGYSMSVLLKNNVGGSGIQTGKAVLGGSAPNDNGEIILLKTNDSVYGQFGYNFMSGKVIFSLNDNSGTPVITMDKDIGINVVGTSVTANAFFGDGSGLTNLPASGVSGSGTADYLPKWSASTALTDSSIYYSGTNLFISATGLIQEQAGTSQQLRLYGGDHDPGNTPGGSVVIRGGSGSATETAGAVSIAGGGNVAGAVGGNVSIDPGFGTGGEAGQVTLFGLNFKGTKTAAQIQALACTNYSDPEPCLVYNTTDNDLYTSTGATAGYWRNSRTGVGP